MSRRDRVADEEELAFGEVFVGLVLAGGDRAALATARRVMLSHSRFLDSPNLAFPKSFECPSQE